MATVLLSKLGHFSPESATSAPFRIPIPENSHFDLLEFNPVKEENV